MMDINRVVEHDKITTETAENRTICEGSAEIISGGNVFYNPVQEFNRDLSTAVLNVYFNQLIKERAAKRNKQINNDALHKDSNGVNAAEHVAGQKCEDGLRILEALSATGLRSIRYAKEVRGIREIIANDLSKQAVQSITENVRHNGVEHLVTASHSNAMTLMYSTTEVGKRFDVVDLDPYGCPNRFLDGAVQSLGDGGLLMVTATDMAVLAGNAPDACFVKYGCVPLRMKSCHEMALRILLHCVEAHANRYGKRIEPLLSISADFYVRIFVRVFISQEKCKYSMCKQSMIYQCTGCETYTLQPVGIQKPNPTSNQPDRVKFGIPTGPPVDTCCAHCGHKHHLGGPIWSASMHDYTFVKELLAAVQMNPLSNLGTQKRIVGMMSMILEELPDVPLYYTMDKLCCVLKLQVMPILKFRSALLHAGYRVSFSHAFKNSIKTDAPAAVLWDILRCWHKRHPVNEKRILDGTPVKAILSKPPTQDYNFDELHPDANPDSRKKALSRFQANPAAHWGPGTRATIMIGEKSKKSFRNQNKSKKSKTSRIVNEAALESTEEEETKCKQLKLE